MALDLIAAQAAMTDEMKPVEKTAGGGSVAGWLVTILLGHCTPATLIKRVCIRRCGWQ